MQNVEGEIKALENEIRRIKLLNSLGKLQLGEAKREIRILESRIKSLMESLPAHQKEMMLLRKEFGKEF